MKTFVIGITGGSGSGKTSLVGDLIKTYGDDILVIKHDDYYKDQSHLTMEERVKTNYDHPSSLDNELLLNDLKKLLEGEKVEIPVYDFVNHTRSNSTNLVEPKKIIILEGILILDNPQIRKLIDLKIFVECDLDTMFIRRLKRDIETRGRTIDSVITQYQLTVKPMFYKFVKPTKRFADILIPNHTGFSNAKDLLLIKIDSILKA